MTQRVRDRIVAEAGGNPLALLELPRGLTAAELAGGFGMPGASALPGSVEESFRRRADALPPEARRLLLVAAAEPLGDPVLVWRAAALLGIGADAARPAADAGLAEIGARVRFRHPLVRSAVYRAASAQDRQQVHRRPGRGHRSGDRPRPPRLAPGPGCPRARRGRRLRTRALGRPGAGPRGPGRRRRVPRSGRRRLRRIPHNGRGGRWPPPRHRTTPVHPTGQSPCLISRKPAPYDPAQRAQVDLLRAQVSFTMTRGGDSVSLLLNAARRLEPVNPRLARETYLDALMAAMFAGHLAVGDGVTEAARAASSGTPARDDQLPADLLLHGLAVRFTDGYTAAMPLLRLAVAAFNQREIPPEQLRWLWLAHIVAGNLWDEHTLDTIHHVDMARDSGALATLPLALATRMGAHVLMGDLTSRGRPARSGRTPLRSRPASPPPLMAHCCLPRGKAESPKCSRWCKRPLQKRSVAAKGLGSSSLVSPRRCSATASAGTRRLPERLRSREATQPRWASSLGVCSSNSSRERLEVGNPARANAAFRDLAVTTQAAGSDWALGIEARSHALLSVGAEAEAAYKEAIDRLEATKIRGELARAHLLYGEWLRREKRRAEARSRLRAAHNMFAEMGMEAFAARQPANSVPPARRFGSAALRPSVS